MNSVIFACALLFICIASLFCFAPVFFITDHYERSKRNRLQEEAINKANELQLKAKEEGIKLARENFNADN